MASWQQPAAPRVDQLPSDPAVLAAMSPEERTAIYLNMIRKMMTFFVVLALVLIVLGVIAFLTR